MAVESDEMSPWCSVLSFSVLHRVLVDSISFPFVHWWEQGSDMLGHVLYHGAVPSLGHSMKVLYH